MTIDEIELYDVDEILSHLSDEDANVVQRAISSLCGMVTIRDKYIKELREKILSLVRNDDTVCMCKEFREMEEGMCHCQLYVKTKDESIQG